MRSKVNPSGWNLRLVGRYPFRRSLRSPCKGGFWHAERDFVSCEGKCLAVLADDGRQHVAKGHASTSFGTMALGRHLSLVVIHLVLSDAVFAAKLKELVEVESLLRRALGLDEVGEHVVAAVLVAGGVLRRDDRLGSLHSGGLRGINRLGRIGRGWIRLSRVRSRIGVGIRLGFRLIFGGILSLGMCYGRLSHISLLLVIRSTG